ncbi:MAG: twin-arginine translocation signal domain-containing protein [Betaproteobacteria bacterium]|nr:twin-arginine translocation signal domain-containing protein [Betaproteobacteria bacterium]NBS45662.1 twin-arginine translocation signal domain-containing protein [Betaproteobacteria bacterium]
MNNRRQFIQGTSAAALLSAIGQQAFAQAGLPIEQVKIFYGFPAGSSGDIVARRVGEKLAGSAYTKNGAVVENKPGAGGRIALDVLKPAPADGTHLALTPFSMLALFPHVYSKLAYDANKDFVPVSMAAIMQHGLAVGPMVPASVKNVKDFLAWAKANPKDASYGSPGAGSTPHFIGALMGIQAGVELKHVPYRGSIPGVTDVVGGQIAAMVTPHGDFLANHKAGKMRILATSGAKRSPFVPEVPTFAEQGFPELVVDEWFSFYAPARTPANVIAAASAAINAAVKDKAVVDALALVGLIAQGSTPEELGRSQKEQFDKWGPLIKKVGFTAES